MTASSVARGGKREGSWPSLCNACNSQKKQPFCGGPHYWALRHLVVRNISKHCLDILKHCENVEYFTLARNGGHVENAPFPKTLILPVLCWHKKHLCFIWSVPSRPITPRLFSFFLTVPNIPHKKIQIFPKYSQHIQQLFAIIPKYSYSESDCLTNITNRARAVAEYAYTARCPGTISDQVSMQFS